ncbi:MAG: beta-ketoacyl-ACP synthase [Burkholderiaceae bacterium]
MSPAALTLTAMSLSSALGTGLAATLDGLRAGRSGLRQDAGLSAGLPTWIGPVAELSDVRMPAHLAVWNCRNNRLALLALEQDDLLGALDRAVRRYGRERIGLFLGTSTSGIAQTEQAYVAAGPDAAPAGLDLPHGQLIHALTGFVRELLDLRGPVQAISTACSSSAKVFAAAQRAIGTGLCDAALVGGVDSLCLTTLLGFNSLQLVSTRPCRPWDAERDGISIGEAAGFALLERTADDQPGIRLRGVGESSDAHHIATPHPDGAGAARAMRAALHMAGIEPSGVDYLNLHGTSTRSNDQSENAALGAVFGARPPPFSSTKGATGHCLGAAGICEAVISALALEHGLLPANVNLERPDPELSDGVLRTPTERRIAVALSNSFGFGGSNCSLLLARGDA